MHPETEFKEFKPQFKFKPRLKYGWLRLNWIQFFKIQAGAQLKPVLGEFETRLKFIKFGHWAPNLVLVEYNLIIVFIV